MCYTLLVVFKSRHAARIPPHTRPAGTAPLLSMPRRAAELWGVRPPAPKVTRLKRGRLNVGSRMFGRRSDLRVMSQTTSESHLRVSHSRPRARLATPFKLLVDDVLKTTRCRAGWANREASVRGLAHLLLQSEMIRAPMLPAWFFLLPLAIMTAA